TVLEALRPWFQGRRWGAWLFHMASRDHDHRAGVKTPNRPIFKSTFRLASRFVKMLPVRPLVRLWRRFAFLPCFITALRDRRCLRVRRLWLFDNAFLR